MKLKRRRKKSNLRSDLYEQLVAQIDSMQRHLMQLRSSQRLVLGVILSLAQTPSRSGRSSSAQRSLMKMMDLASSRLEWLSTSNSTCSPAPSAAKAKVSDLT